MSFFSNSLGVCQPSPKGIGDGATVSQGDSFFASHCRPCQGTCEEALRPAWPIWMPIGALRTVRQ
jgi:hypothetical protein